MRALRLPLRVEPVAYAYSGNRQLADGCDVGTDKAGALLIEVALASLFVAVGEVCEGIGRSDRVDLVLAMVVEGDVQERVVSKPQDQVANVVRAGLRKLSEHRLDPALILIGGLGGDGGIPSDHPELCWRRCGCPRARAVLSTHGVYPVTRRVAHCGH